jgi:hypothetical protein
LSIQWTQMSHASPLSRNKHISASSRRKNEI